MIYIVCMKKVFEIKIEIYLKQNETDLMMKYSLT